MNGRTARKMLMQGKSRYMFGPRAFLRVAIPYSALPEPLPPPVPKERVGEMTGMLGHWKRIEGDTRVSTMISELTSSGDPRNREHPFGIYQLEIEEYEVNEYADDESPLRVIGKTIDRTYRWWEGQVAVFPKDDNNLKVISRVAADADLVNMHADRCKWVSKYARGTTSYTSFESAGITVPFLQHFHEASCYAKATNPMLFKDHLTLVYAVKWWHHDTKLAFCAAFARGVKTAKRAGHDVRAYRCR